MAQQTVCVIRSGIAAGSIFIIIIEKGPMYVKSGSKESVKQLLLSIAIALAAGGLSALLSGDTAGAYAVLPKPSLAPPGFVFPLVWTVLYTLMGVSAYLVFRSDSPQKSKALAVYALQLLVNILWPLFFFRFQAYGFAFAWLLLLLGLVVWMIRLFYSIRPAAALLQLPYLLWLVFAGYLNYSIALG